MKRRVFKTLKNLQSQSCREGVEHKLSIAVRVLNEIKGLKLFWDSLNNQTYFDQAEIVFLDSGSEDGSLEFLKSIDCNLYCIDGGEFSYGDTCNLMMDLTSTNTVFFFSGHVVLESHLLIETVVRFVGNKDISGYFRQIPNPEFGSSVYDDAFLKNRFPSHAGSDDPIKVSSGKHSFSNAASFINRFHWQNFLFPEVIYGEDEIWVERVLKNGGNVVYFSSLNILHSHNDTYDQVYKRVSKAAKVKYPGGVNFFKKAFIFSKVFGAIFLNSQNFIASFRYAVAHTRAYAHIKKTV